MQLLLAASNAPQRFALTFVWSHYAFTLCLALLLFAHLAWLVTWFHVTTGVTSFATSFWSALHDN
jgi:uncharacterized membrane protein